MNALPGVDRQLVSQDIGELNLSVGIIHRNATGAAGGGGRGGRGGGGAAPPSDCGVSSGRKAAPGESNTLDRDVHHRLGRGNAGHRWIDLERPLVRAESRVTTTLNGPSCSGTIVGDVQVRDVVVGDIVIIPAGVPHGWLNIPRHVDYLSVRPDPDRVLPSDYVHPSITVYR